MAICRVAKRAETENSAERANRQNLAESQVAKRAETKNSAERANRQNLAEKYIQNYNINKPTDALARSSWSNCPLLDAMCELSGLQNLTQNLRRLSWPL